MQYKIVAEVVGNLFIPDNVCFEFRGYEFDFISDDKGRLKSIGISKKVPDDRVEKFKSTFGPGKGQSVGTINIGGDIETHEELVDQLQMLESALAFSSKAALERINWDAPEQEYIPETPDDEQLIAIRSFRYSRQYPKSKSLLQPDFIKKLVEYAPKYDELRVAKAFWREGMVFFNRFQYVQAFYQFYFVIEDFFASGKSGKKQVLSEFHKSSEFEELCNKTLIELFKTEKHRENLKRFFEECNCEPTHIGLQELLFEMRGALHHFSSGSSRPKGTPFNQKEFESISLLSMYLVTLAIGYREAAISQNINQQR